MPRRRRAEGSVRHGCAQTVFDSEGNSFWAQHGFSRSFIPIQAPVCQPQPGEEEGRGWIERGERAVEMKKKEKGGLRSQPMRCLLTDSPCFEISPHCSFVPQGGCTTSMVERAFAYRGDRGRKRKEERRGWGGRPYNASRDSKKA